MPVILAWTEAIIVVQLFILCSGSPHDTLYGSTYTGEKSNIGYKNVVL